MKRDRTVDLIFWIVVVGVMTLAILSSGCSSDTGSIAGPTPLPPAGEVIQPTPKPQPVCRQVTIPAVCELKPTTAGIITVCTPERIETVCE
jgi:hypothetical protein